MIGQTSKTLRRQTLIIRIMMSIFIMLFAYNLKVSLPIDLFILLCQRQPCRPTSIFSLVNIALLCGHSAQIIIFNLELVIKEQSSKGNKLYKETITKEDLGAMDKMPANPANLQQPKETEMQQEPEDEAASLTTVNNYSEIAATNTATTQNRLPPRKMIDTNFPIYFMHVGKTGGSSLNSLLTSLNRNRKLGGKYYFKRGQNHFDWSFIQQHRLSFNITTRKVVSKESAKEPHLVEEYDVTKDADVLTFLRHPVQRSISQFYYAIQLHNHKKKEGEDSPQWTLQTMDEYMNDANKTFMQPLADGEGGVRYLAGAWKNNDWLFASDESEMKRYLRNNKTAAVLRAVERLDSTTWFGLLEYKDQSLKLLQLTLGLNEPLRLTRSHMGTYEEPSQATKDKIREHLPQDMWLYEYAKRLFEARWEYFARGGTYKHPELPPLPNFLTNDECYGRSALKLSVDCITERH